MATLGRVGVVLIYSKSTQNIKAHSFESGRTIQNISSKVSQEGWGDGSACKVSDGQAQGPKFDSLTARHDGIHL